MLSFASREVFENEEGGFTIFQVQSSRCPYKVVVRRDEVSVVGPGVAEHFALPEELQGLSPEGQALVAVIMFEEMEK